MTIQYTEKTQADRDTEKFGLHLEDNALVERYVRLQVRVAMERYQSLFSNELFSLAVADHSTEYANRLIDAALALCGHPRFSLTMDRWDRAALLFLARFC